MCNWKIPLLWGQVRSYWKRRVRECAELWTLSTLSFLPLLVSRKWHLSHQLLPGYRALVSCRFLCLSLCSDHLSVKPTEHLDLIHPSYINVFVIYKSRWKSLWISKDQPTTCPDHFFNDVPFLEQIHTQGSRITGSLVNNPTFDFPSRKDCYVRPVCESDLTGRLNHPLEEMELTTRFHPSIKTGGLSNGLCCHFVPLSTALGLVPARRFILTCAQSFDLSWKGMYSNVFSSYFVFKSLSVSLRSFMHRPATFLSANLLFFLISVGCKVTIQEPCWEIAMCQALDFFLRVEKRTFLMTISSWLCLS